jgi:hypothetical protein
VERGGRAVLSRVKDWIRMKSMERCFRKLKHEQLNIVGFPRFYLITKCAELAEFNPDWKRVVYLFHLSHTGIDVDDHLVVHFVRWLRG